MQKKSPVVGALLGLFVIGLIYSGGLKKGGLAALVLIVVGFGLIEIGRASCRERV